MTKIAIIGTAGRREDKDRMTSDLYVKMAHHALEWITERFAPSRVTLVSGGAAWADHVAVSLFLSRHHFQGLNLHFPAPFRNSKFQEMGFNSPGGIANYYHHLFSLKMGRSRDHTLRMIQAALDRGATNTVSAGFRQRNRLVGGSEILLAYTWGPSPHFPKQGGTKDTWDNSHATTKIHIPLESF